MLTGLIIAVLLLNLATSLFLARAVGTIALGVEDLRTQLDVDFEAQVRLHALTRRYLHELFVVRLFPHMGFREPAKTPAEKFALDVWKKESEGQ